MRALLVFDKFKDSMSAREAVTAAEEALRGTLADCMIDRCPLSDGGEGFAEILTSAAGGSLHTLTVSGPRGTPVAAHFGIVEASRVPAAALHRLGIARGVTRIGVVEMAQASGLALLRADERDVWQTTTEGTGQLLVAAWRAGAEALLLGIGGSATNDLGLGALSALGVIPLATPERALLPPVPARWPKIRQLAGDLSPGLPPVRIACDVANPLLGLNGCAAVYGPQKGLRASDVARLDHEADRVSELVCRFSGKPLSLRELPGAGAAGGIAFGLVAAANAVLVPGFDLVADWLDLRSRISQADVVLTGEGRFDASSLAGKGPGAVAREARDAGKSVHVFTGVVATDAVPGIALHAITPPGTPLGLALAEAPANLRRTVALVFGA